jgi:FtsZ-binding cell division protein ZapB
VRNQMQEKYEPLAKFARCDGKPARPVMVDFEGEEYLVQRTEDGQVEFYTAKLAFVKHMISTMPNRYKLFDSDPVIAKYTDPGTKASTYKHYYPWVYKRVAKAKRIDGQPVYDQNGEVEMEFTFVWDENLSAKPAGSPGTNPAVNEAAVADLEKKVSMTANKMNAAQKRADEATMKLEDALGVIDKLKEKVSTMEGEGVADELKKLIADNKDLKEANSKMQQQINDLLGVTVPASNSKPPAKKKAKIIERRG